MNQTFITLKRASEIVRRMHELLGKMQELDDTFNEILSTNSLKSPRDDRTIKVPDSIKHGLMMMGGLDTGDDRLLIPNRMDWLNKIFKKNFPEQEIPFPEFGQNDAERKKREEFARIRREIMGLD